MPRQSTTVEEALVNASAIIDNEQANLIAEILGILKTKVPADNTVALQNKTVTPTTAQQKISAEEGYDGLGVVTINAIQTETKTVTPSMSIQEITPTSGKYLTKVTVNAATNMISDALNKKY